MEEEVKPSLGKCMGNHWRGLIITFLPIMFVTAMFINDEKSSRCLYLIIGMFICYVFDIYPYPITGMLPVIALPLMNIMTSDKVCSLFFKEVLVNFVICIIINLAMEYSKLYIRFSLNIVKAVGCCIKRLHIFLIVVTVLLSFLVPNATAITFMYPITKGVLECLSTQGLIKLHHEDNHEEKRPTKIAICFYLSIAYASSMGGSAILMASSANLEVMTAYEEKFPDAPDKIDSIHYLGYAMPPAIIYIVLMALCMEITHMGLFRKGSPEAMACEISPEACTDANRAIADKYHDMPKMSSAECVTCTLLFFALIAIYTRDPGFYTGWMDLVYGEELHNASVAAIVAYLIFGLPANLNFFKCWDVKSATVTPGLLTWKYVHANLPWSMIFVIGCGGALAEGVKISGLEDSIGDMLAHLKNLPAILNLLVVILFAELCTTVTTNTAVLRVISPAVLKMAVESKLHPLYLLMPACLAGSMSFLLPPSTPPNAYVAVRENIQLKDMLFAGILPTIASILTIFLFGSFFGKVVYSNLGEYPDWADNSKASYFN